MKRIYPALLPLSTVFLLIGLLVLSSCNSSRKLPKEGEEGEVVKEQKCKYVGVVKDMRGLDGCEFFIVMEDNKELAVTNWDKFNWEPVDSQKVSFDYKVMKDMMSVCMAEDAIVRLTCLELNE